MSYFVITGDIPVGNGRRVSVPTNRGNNTWFSYYDTALPTANDGTPIPAELRIYSPPGHTPLADNTVVAAGGRAAFPQNLPAIADMFFMEPYNIACDADLDVLPSNPRICASGLGVVQARSDAGSLAQPKSITLEVSERVRDQRMSFPVQCFFAGNPVRWSNVPSPQIQSHVAFFGTLTGRTPAGVLTVDLEHITFNALAPAPTVGGNGQPPSPSTPKRRRFDFRSSPAVAPPPPTLAPPTASSSGPSSQDSGSAVTYGNIVQTYPPPAEPAPTAAEPANTAALGTASNTGRTRGEKRKGPAGM